MVEKLGIAEAVAALRSELVKAIAQGDREAVRFGLKEVELELEVAATVGTGGKAEISWWVVSFGGEHNVERAGTHRVKLTLVPTVLGKDLQIGSTETSRD